MDSMAECEICGKPLLGERKARIDGVVFRVCDGCVKLGDEMPVIMPVKKKAGAEPFISEDDYVTVPDFGGKLKNARERKGISQEELAARIMEKASVIRRVEHNFEAGEMIMKKLERFLGIKFYEKPESAALKGGKGELALTIGDVAEVRRKVQPR